MAHLKKKHVINLKHKRNQKWNASNLGHFKNKCISYAAYAYHMQHMHIICCICHDVKNICFLAHFILPPVLRYHCPFSPNKCLMLWQNRWKGRIGQMSEFLLSQNVSKIVCNHFRHNFDKLIKIDRSIIIAISSIKKLVNEVIR